MPVNSRRTFLMGLGALGTMSGLAALGIVSGLGIARFLVLPSANKEHSQSALQMGTFFTITARHASASLMEEAFGQAFHTVAKYEAIFSRHSATTPLAILNAQGSLGDAPPALVALLQQALQFSHTSNTAFNPAVLPVLQALSSYAVPTIEHLPPSILRDVTRLADPKGIVIQGTRIQLANQEMGISLDGIAKGYIVDKVAQVLEQHGIYDYLVNGGGDIRASVSSEQGEQAEPWRIGVQDAASPEKFVSTITLRKAALASSGNYESLASHGYHHLIALPLGIAESSLRSVSIIAPTCTEADAMATAFFAMTAQKALSFTNARPPLASLLQTEKGSMLSRTWPRRA